MKNFILKENKRNYGIDLLKIVSMFLVVAIHIMNIGGIVDNCPELSLNWFVIKTIYIPTDCCVNCFALVTGYLMVNKNVKVKNFFYIWVQTFFYSVLISLAFVVIGSGRHVAIGSLIHSFTPIIENKYWYITSYLFMMPFIPAMNKCINNIDKKTYLKTLISMFLIFSVISYFFGAYASDIASGYSVFWLIILYFIGAYIKKYPPKFKTKSLLLVILALICITVLLLVLEIYLINNFNLVLAFIKFNNTLGYNSPTILIMSVAIFICFSRIKVSKDILKKLLKIITPLTLGAYLIHTNDFVLTDVIEDRFSFLAYQNPILMVLGVFGIALAIFIVCIIIDYVRYIIFKFLKPENLMEKIYKILKIKIIKIFNK